MPGAKPPQPEAPVMPVKAETTAAALQLLQPKSLQGSAPAARMEPSSPSVALHEPSKSVPAATASSTHASTTDSARSPSPLRQVHADTARQRSPSPQLSVAAVESKRDADVYVRRTPPASDDETHSDASDGEEMQLQLQLQLQQRAVATKPSHAQPAGACSITCS